MAIINEITSKEWVQQNEPIDDFLAGRVESTIKQYRTRLRRFFEYIDMPPQEFLDEAKENKVKTKTKINKFYRHLLNQDLASRTALNYEDAIKSFLAYHELRVKTRQKRTTRKYKRAVLRKEEIKKLYDAATSWRLKCLIIIGYQTGMDISSLITLNYSDVKNAIEKNVFYHIIEYIRGKAKIEAKAIIGRDSINTLRKYINWVKQRGYSISDDRPLFVSIRDLKEQKRISERTAQVEMRKTIVSAGLATFEELETYGKFNPYSFHAIRKAFISVAKQYGIPFEQVEMSVGHMLNYNGAYDEYKDNEMFENFKKAEPHLSISIDTKEIQEKSQEQQEELKLLRQGLEEMRTQYAEILELKNKLKDKLLG